LKAEKSSLVLANEHDTALDLIRGIQKSSAYPLAVPN
jgi:hypothetical protein